MKSPSFKLKLYSIVVAIIFTTILTSYFSANRFIESYIETSGSSVVQEKLQILNQGVSEKLGFSFQQARSLDVSFINVKEIVTQTEFENITKVAANFVFDRSGIIDDSQKIQALNSEIARANAELTANEVIDIDGQKILKIIIKTSDTEATILDLNLNYVTGSLSHASGNGDYLSLTAPNGEVIFDNRPSGELITFDTELPVLGNNWTLSAYLDRAITTQNAEMISGKITQALLWASVIIIPFSMFIIALLLKPIASLQTVVRGLASGEGDLTQRLEVKSNDEFGAISTDINHFIEHLQQMITGVKSSCSETNLSVEELGSQNQNNQGLFTSHQAEVDSVVTSINQVSASSEAVASDAQSAADLTEQAKQESEKSKQVVANAMTSMNELLSEVDNTSEAIVAMSEDTQRIESVLHVIGEIAEQTNLLALNAAIEAARAGEQGRGFAVVADEVRALASRTRQSTDEINDMLAKLQAASHSVVSSMDSTKSRCEAASQQTNEVTITLDSMTQFTEDINQLVAQIASSVKEQSTVTELVNQNMVAINEMVQTLVNNGENTIDQTQKLSNQNLSLLSSVDKFRV